MIRTLMPGRVCRGSLPAIPSKSDAHRLLLCAALADAPTEIEVGKGELSADIHATMACIRVLGGDVTAEGEILRVTPIRFSKSNESILCNCGESGSTARFLLPIAAAAGHITPITLSGHGRLPLRPFAPLCDALRARGADIYRDLLPITVRGGLQAGEFTIAGNISSQYITGLLLALPLLEGDSRITLTTPLESRGYVDMTLSTLARFGIHVKADAAGWKVPAAPYRSPGRITADGDWSNAAFWLCAGAVSAPMTVTGLSSGSRQGDRRITDILAAFGARVTVGGDAVTVSPAPLRGVTLSVADIPDLVPILAVVAAAAKGETRFIDAGRLRLKESDRLATVSAMICALGGDADIDGDTLIIRGGKPLCGGTVDSANDHRIAMSAAVAALLCTGTVELQGAEAVEKSYPAFWTDYDRLSGEQI
ncbi:MAG: 3-phosphoshikimate 1-carboxyvinyltransferase [Clostridia bacterium]|nr:3-phosphoshikimate 1-carboxyvinyltransferase [Clostridia bacterium]